MELSPISGEKQRSAQYTRRATISAFCETLRKNYLLLY